MGFPLVPILVTLNGAIVLILCYFTQFDSFGGRLAVVQSQSITITEVEDRPVMSAKYRLHFWPKLTHPAARSLCDSRAACFTFKH